MSLFSRLKKFRRQCSLRLRIRRQRNQLDAINKLHPQELVKPVDDIISELDELILKRGISNWVVLVESYFSMKLNYKGRNTADYVWFSEWMHELDLLFATCPEEEALLNNKHRLTRYLNEHGVRSTQGLGLLKASGGKPVLLSEDGVEEPLEEALRKHGALFCKPQDLYKGIGCILLEDAPGGCRVNGRQMSHEQLISTSVLADGHEMQVEMVVRQHPAISAFHAKAVNTMRLTTLRDRETGKPAYFQGLMRMGNGDSVVDNVAQGGVCLGVAASGQLMTPGIVLRGCAMLPATQHPTSGLSFEGFTIPFFEEAKELVCRAHSLFAERQIFMSWDVAITPDGPCIIECNTRGDTSVLQMFHGGWHELFEGYVKPTIRKAVAAH